MLPRICSSSEVYGIETGGGGERSTDCGNSGRSTSSAGPQSNGNPVPVSETTSLGAAYGAGLTVGYFRDADELRAKWAVGGTWDAAFRGSGTGKGVPAVEKAVTPSLDWAE